MSRIAVLIFVALALAACQAAPKPDKAAVDANRALFDQIRTGQDQAVLAQLPPNAQAQGAALLARLKTVIPATAPSKVEPVAASLAQGSAGKIEVLVMEYDFPDRAIQFATTLGQPKGAAGWKLGSFSLLEKTHQELAPNTLSLDHRSPAQLGFFALAFTSPLLMLAALIKVLRTPGLTYKWLWGVFAFVGLFSFQMNWATGIVLVNWMALQIFGFWLAKAPSQFEPWMISATVPIGALLILGGAVARRPKTA